MNKLTQREGLEYALENNEEFQVSESKYKQYRTNFFPLNRSVQDDNLWTSKEPFDRRSAWLDLLMGAKYTTGTKKEYIDGRIVEIKRGQLVRSYRFLQKRWRWKSTWKVQNFLKYLEKDGKTVHQRVQGITVITICNYARYNKVPKS